MENKGPDETLRIWRMIWICAFCAITKTCLFKYTEKLITEKLKIFRQKIQIFFIFLLKNIDCGSLRGDSNENPQSMFLSRNKKNNVYPYKPQFYYIKVGFKGVKIIKACFSDAYLKTRFRLAGPHICIFLKDFDLDR